MDEQRDRKRGVVDRANSAINTANNLRNAVRLARTAATVGRTVTAAAATSEVWIPAVIIIVIVLIIIFTLFILLGHGSGIALDSQGGSSGGPTPGGGGTTNALASCPVSDGTISTPSYQVDPINGHCGELYIRAGFPCPTNSRTARAIDVLTGGSSGKDVVLPTIQGQSLQWKYVSFTSIPANKCDTPVRGSCGLQLAFVADLGSGKNWVIHLAHIQSTNLKLGDVFPSGTIVGKTLISHVHIVIGKDISDPYFVPLGNSDFRQGWLDADKDLGMCVVISNTASNTCTKQYEGKGPCSVSSLMPYFGNDSTKSLIASLICESESGSNPFSLNDNCRTNDYSVGLFQINAVAHCPGAYGNLSCRNLLDIQKRSVCENNWYDPAQNIGKAKEIVDAWSGWTAWGTWLNAGKNPPVKEILTKCGISY